MQVYQNMCRIVIQVKIEKFVGVLSDDRGDVGDLGGGCGKI